MPEADSSFPRLPLPDAELTAIAELMAKQPDGEEQIAERIAALALECNAGGVATWKEIARRVRAIRSATPP